MKFFAWITVYFLFVFSVVLAADDFVPADQENVLIGTSSQSFIIDSANEGGDIVLQFGDTLGVAYQDLQRSLIPLFQEWEKVSLEMEEIEQQFSFKTD